MPLCLCPTKAANTPFMIAHSYKQLWLPMIQNQTSLTLRWRSFSWWGRGMSLSLCPTKAANTSFMTAHSHLQLWLPMMQNQKSLTLCWHSFSWWGREHVATSLFYKGGQYASYVSPQPLTTLITNDAKPKIIHAPLMLILMYCLVNICRHQ